MYFRENNCDLLKGTNRKPFFHVVPFCLLDSWKDLKHFIPNLHLFFLSVTYTFDFSTFHLRFCYLFNEKICSFFTNLTDNGYKHMARVPHVHKLQVNLCFSIHFWLIFWLSCFQCNGVLDFLMKEFMSFPIPFLTVRATVFGHFANAAAFQFFAGIALVLFCLLRYQRKW